MTPLRSGGEMRERGRKGGEAREEKERPAGKERTHKVRALVCERGFGFGLGGLYTVWRRGASWLARSSSEKKNRADLRRVLPLPAVFLPLPSLAEPPSLSLSFGFPFPLLSPPSSRCENKLN